MLPSPGASAGRAAVSYDLQIIAKKQPKAVHVRAVPLIADGTVSGRGTLQRGGHLLLTDAVGVVVDVDGPSAIDDEDVPDAASGAIGATGWLVQLSMKPSTEATWPQELAIQLARAADGVVYDPQLHRVTWPKGFQPRDRETGEVRIEQIAFDWFTTWPSDDRKLPLRLLGLLRSHYPEGLPRRYGGYEPMPFRFQGEGAADAFIERWIETASAWTPMLFWTTTRPCLSGSASMSTARAPERQRPGEAIVHVSLDVDGRALARDPAYNERAVDLFRVVATELRCVYAAASVERGMLVGGSHISSDYRTEAAPMPRTDRWVGLPASPTWLAWFGMPYRDLVRASLAEAITAETDTSLFVRMGTEPMNADELADRFPALPPHLLAQPTNQPGQWLPNGSYTLVTGPPSQPAQEIPKLTRVDR